jgi:hypothetical protein
MSACRLALSLVACVLKPVLMGQRSVVPNAIERSDSASGDFIEPPRLVPKVGFIEQLLILVTQSVQQGRVESADAEPVVRTVDGEVLGQVLLRKPLVAWVLLRKPLA